MKTREGMRPDLWDFRMWLCFVSFVYSYFLLIWGAYGGDRFMRCRSDPWHCDCWSGLGEGNPMSSSINPGSPVLDVFLMYLHFFRTGLGVIREWVAQGFNI